MDVNLESQLELELELELDLDLDWVVVVVVVVKVQDCSAQAPLGTQQPIHRYLDLDSRTVQVMTA